jgi:DNA-binding transcriptional MerR regulator
MEILKDKYSITELSERLSVTDHTLRYYEKEFCIKIPKDSRGRRCYTSELANIMYQIKNMRDEGLEIKAIKKILLSENVIPEPPTVLLGDQSSSLAPVATKNIQVDMVKYLDTFREQLTSSISSEVLSAREYLVREINHSKLELGACVENSARKLETKMERHFQEVDKALGVWREKNKGGFLKRFLNKHGIFL